MKLSLTPLNNRNFPFQSLASPPSRSEANESQKTNTPDESVVLSEAALDKQPKTWSSRRVALTALTAVSALTALAGPVTSRHGSPDSPICGDYRALLSKNSDFR